MFMLDQKHYPSEHSPAMTVADQKSDKIIVQGEAPRVKDMNICGDVSGRLKPFVVAPRSGES